jgi:TctA family transporter
VIAAETANHAAAGVVVLFAIGLPGVAVGLAALGAWLSGRAQRGTN